MIIFSKDELRDLAKRSGFPCVSLFLPTHRVTAHTEQDRIRLKNLMQQAGEHLTARELRAPEVKDLLGPAQRLYENNLFWQHQSDGLAIFLTPGFAEHYRLPLEFTDLVVVSERFHLKPLLPLFTGDGRFYVLAISQDEVRLLEGTRHSVAKVDLTGVPQSLAEALKYDAPEKQRDLPTGEPLLSSGQGGHHRKPGSAAPGGTPPAGLGHPGTLVPKRAARGRSPFSAARRDWPNFRRPEGNCPGHTPGSGRIPVCGGGPAAVGCLRPRHRCGTDP
jgi:Bacterial archaeo-eukaryotic release factor family 3